MSTDEALAVARLRQWTAMRTALNQGRAVRPASEVKQRRRESSFNAAQVRVIDFERALNKLSDDQRLTLVFIYRDGYTEAETACLLGCSVRKISYVLPIARKELAEVLDRDNLL